MFHSTLLKWVTASLITMTLIGGWTRTSFSRADANTWYVATHGSDISGDGSQTNPFSTIQHGIDIANDGDTILVFPGVYRENIDFTGKNILVGSFWLITGEEDYILQTVIDGNRNNHTVSFTSGEEAAATLSGFTITRGYAHGTSSPGSHGGGIFCTYSNPTLTHLRVTGNEADGEGGGLYFAHCSPAIRDISVTNNRADGGGGMRYSYGSLDLENVLIAHNWSSSGGAGAQLYHSEGTIKNALIADNTGGAKGGGVQFDGCSPLLINVTIVGNWTAGQGGGLNVSYMSQPTLVNSIVWGNSPQQIYFDPDWGGEAVTIEYSDIQGGLAGIVTNNLGPVNWGAGNLDLPPRFANGSLSNYHLAVDSPCINAGTPSGAPLTDLEGNPRPDPLGTYPDLGAYESPFGLFLYLPIISYAVP
jgi:hypothetical protein